MLLFILIKSFFQPVIQQSSLFHFSVHGADFYLIHAASVGVAHVHDAALCPLEAVILAKSSWIRRFIDPLFM